MYSGGFVLHATFAVDRGNVVFPLLRKPWECIGHVAQCKKVVLSAGS